jgi:hypothetical protein
MVNIANDHEASPVAAIERRKQGSRALRRQRRRPGHRPDGHRDALPAGRHQARAGRW